MNERIKIRLFLLSAISSGTEQISEELSPFQLVSLYASDVSTSTRISNIYIEDI